MKSWSTFVAVLLMVGFVSAGFAADPVEKPKAAKPAGDKPAKAKALKGKLVKIDGTKLVLAVGKKGEEAKEVTIVTDASTVIVIEGKEKATLADIPAGATIAVTPETGTAQKITVAPVKAPKAPKAAK